MVPAFSRRAPFNFQTLDNMKSIFTYIFIIALMACNTQAGVNAEDPSASSNAIPGLYERTGTLATAPEWPKTKARVDELRAAIAADASATKQMLQLAIIYISEARITGEHPYYYPAIENILNRVLAIDKNSYEATVLLASVKMSQHKFKDALAVAEKAKTLNPADAYVYAMLTDANVELGNYEEAVACSDKMQSLKPSLESYSRASYLREIYGNYKGAIQAMKMAVEAGLPGSEPQCWSMKTLGDLYLNSGDVNSAEAEFKTILNIRPSYAFAKAGLAKVEQKKGNYNAALMLLDSAAAILPEFSFHEQMADIYALQKNDARATEKYAEVEKMLKEDEASGHVVNLELAKLYLKMDRVEDAKKYAMMEYAVRPKNIDVNNELAWISFKEKNLIASRSYIKVAKRTGSKDPELMQRSVTINRS